MKAFAVYLDILRCLVGDALFYCMESSVGILVHAVAEILWLSCSETFGKRLGSVLDGTLGEALVFSYHIRLQNFEWFGIILKNLGILQVKGRFAGLFENAFGRNVFSGVAFNALNVTYGEDFVSILIEDSESFAADALWHLGSQDDAAWILIAVNWADHFSGGVILWNDVLLWMCLIAFWTQHQLFERHLGNLCVELWSCAHFTIRAEGASILNLLAISSALKHI